LVFAVARLVAGTGVAAGSPRRGRLRYPDHLVDRAEVCIGACPQAFRERLN
jgi:hypothetical protein